MNKKQLERIAELCSLGLEIEKHPEANKDNINDIAFMNGYRRGSLYAISLIIRDELAALNEVTQ